MAEVKTDARRKRFVEVKSEADDLAIKVYPMAYAQLDANADTIAIVLKAVASIDYTKLREAGMSAAGIWWMITPIVGTQTLRLVNECCVPSLDSVEAPADVVIECAIRWIDLSFMTGGLSRVLAAAESLLARHVAAFEPPTTRTPSASPPSSASDSATKPSTVPSDATGRPTEGGASRSSPPTAAPSADS